MYVSFDYIIQRLSYGGERTLEGGLSDIERADIRKNAEAFLWDAIKAEKINCTGNLYIRQDNSGYKRELNPSNNEERACAKEFMENKDNILWLRAFRDGKGVYIRFAFKSFDFLPELCPCEATPFLCVENPVFDKEEADRLLSGKEPICFQFTTDKNQPAETTEVAGNKAFHKENGRKGGKADKRNKVLKKFVEDYHLRNLDADFKTAWKAWKKHTEYRPYSENGNEIYFTNYSCFVNEKSYSKQTVRRYLAAIKKDYQKAAC